MSPSRRSSLKMKEQDLMDFVRQRWIMVLGTVGHNGWPHLVTMGYGLIGESLVFTTYRNAQKAVNLLRDPHVSCLIEDPGNTYADIKGILILGQAEPVEDRLQVAEMLERVKEQMISTGRPLPERSPSAERTVAKRIGVIVKPEKVLSWDHGLLAGAY